MNFPLEELSKEKVALHNVIVGKLRDGSFEVNGNPCNFQFCSKLTNYTPGTYFKLKVSDYEIGMTLDRLPHLENLSGKYEGIEFDNLPQEIQPVILQSVWKDIIAKVEKTFGTYVSVEQFAKDPMDFKFQEELYFTIDIHGSAPIHGCFHLELPAVEYIAALLERSYVYDINRFRSINFPLRVLLGQQDLPAKDLRSINKGDIILFSGEKYFENGDCQVLLGNRYLYNANLKEGVVVLSDFMKDILGEEGEEGSMAWNEDEDLDFDQEELEDDESDFEESEGEEPSAEAEEPQPAAEEDQPETQETQPEAAAPPPAAAPAPSADVKQLQGLPIKLTFEVGQKRMSFDQLSSIKSGFTFELDNAVEKPVTIRANGKYVGEGELLQVNGRVGVRVSHFKNNA